MSKAVLLVEPGGDVICLYTELIPLQSLGRIKMKRATTLEFNEAIQEWQVIETDCDAVYHSHPSRQNCLEWERRTFSRPRNLRDLKKQRKKP